MGLVEHQNKERLLLEDHCGGLFTNLSNATCGICLCGPLWGGGGGVIGRKGVFADTAGKAVVCCLLPLTALH